MILAALIGRCIEGRMKKLTAKQKVFVDEYLIDFNATRAALAAGYSKGTASDSGFENLQKPNVQEAIRLEQDKRKETTLVTAEMKIQALWEMTLEARGNEDINAAKGCIAELNKMQGDIAPTKTENKNSHSIEDFLLSGISS